MNYLPTCVAWSPDGSALAFGGLRCVVLWARDGARILGSTGVAYMYGLAFSPDGALLACGTESRNAKLVSRDGRKVAKLPGDSGIVSHLSFAPDGKHVLGGRALWGLDGKAIRRMTFSMMSRYVDSRTIASAGPDYDEDLKNPSLWLLTPEGEEVHRVRLSKCAREIAVDGDRIAVAEDGPRVHVFSKQGERLGEIVHGKSEHAVASVAVSGAHVATGGWGDTDVWVTAFDGKRVAKVRGFKPPFQGNGLAFAKHEPRWLAALTESCGLITDIDTGDEIRLYADGKSWLAVDDRGRYQGAKQLSPDAKVEAPELLAGLFT
jgi:WD40 repeat protein